MLNLQTIESLIYTIAFIIAYLIAETLSGWFRAYVAKKMGDDTPEQLGFLSLNPLVHIDPIGLFFLIKLGFGWGRAAPITPENIDAPYKNIKIACAFFSDTCAHFVLALCSFSALISIFGAKMIMIAQPILDLQYILLTQLHTAFPQFSSFTLSIGIILVALLYLCLILAVLNFIVNGFRLLMLLCFDESLGRWYIDIIIPMILIFVFADPLMKIVIKSIIYLANHITTLSTYFN